MYYAQDHDRWVDPPKEEEEESGQENQKELVAA
jgi:hypothetical protein